MVGDRSMGRDGSCIMKRYPAKSLPMRCLMSCGCVIRLSKRQARYGEAWCRVHRQAARVTESLPVVAKVDPAQPGLW